MPFVSAFAYTEIITLPLIFSLFLFILMVLKIIQTGKLPEGFIGIDLVIISLLSFLVLFSFIINGRGNTKSLNHTVAYLSTFMLFYVGIKFTFLNIQNKQLLFKRFLQFITYTTIISALYTNAEFISFNVFGTNLNNFIPRPTEAEKWYDATVLGLFYRARGFAPESGHFAFMMEIFSPLAIYYMYFSRFCLWPKLIKAILVSAIILSFIFAVSTASFVIIPIAVLFALLIYFKSFLIYLKRNTAKFLFTSGVVSVTVILFNYLFSFYTLIILSITDKLNSISFDDRQARINFFHERFFNLDLIHKLIGTGPSGYTLLGFDESNTILSLYYSVIFELGYLGIFLLSIFLLYVLWNTVRIKSKIGFFLLVSVFSGMMHYHFIENFWYPWFWTILAFAVFCNKYYSKEVR